LISCFMSLPSLDFIERAALNPVFEQMVHPTSLSFHTINGLRNSPNSSKRTSPGFLDLPAELRIEIYRYCRRPDDFIDLRFTSGASDIISDLQEWAFLEFPNRSATRLMMFSGAISHSIIASMMMMNDGFNKSLALQTLHESVTCNWSWKTVESHFLTFSVGLQSSPA